MNQVSTAPDADVLIDLLELAGFEDARADPPVGGYRMHAARRPQVMAERGDPIRSPTVTFGA
jgi:hypothetical protein